MCKSGEQRTGFPETLEKAQKQPSKDSPDEQTILQDRLQNLQINAEKQKQELRGKFATWARRIVSSWLIFIAVVLIFVGAFNFFYSIALYSNTVLITLLAATTINVIALSMVIIKGLFADR